MPITNNSVKDTINLRMNNLGQIPSTMSQKENLRRQREKNQSTNLNSKKRRTETDPTEREIKRILGYTSLDMEKAEENAIAGEGRGDLLKRMLSVDHSEFVRFCNKDWNSI